MKSLRARFILLSAVWISVILGLSIAVLYILTQRHFVGQYTNTLSTHAHTLSTYWQSEPAQVGRLPAGLDPRYQQPNSGWYWQVESKGEVTTSPSLAGDRVPALMDIPVRTPTEVETLFGLDVVVIRYEVDLGQPESSYLLLALDEELWEEPYEEINEVYSRFLLVLGVGLVLASAGLVFLGLKPLTALRANIQAVHSGQATRLEGQYPTELQVLVDDVNTLIETQSANMERARQYAGDLAHGLKTPLSVLDVSSQSEATLPSTIVAQQVSTMREMVDYHLTKARAAAVAFAGASSADVTPALESLITVMARLHPQISLVFDAQGMSPRVAMDPRDLNEVLGNILDNACKWASTEVEITVDVHTDAVSVRMSDDGPGVPETQIATIFQRGKRLDEKTPGTGLGLSIVQVILEAYGGTIVMSRSMKNGLSVEMILPTQAVTVFSKGREV